MKTKSGNNLTDEQLEGLFQIISRFMIPELEEIAPMLNKTDEQCEEILKVAMKAIETSTIVLSEFLNPNSFDVEKIGHVKELLKQNQYESAQKYIFGEVTEATLEKN